MNEDKKINTGSAHAYFERKLGHIKDFLVSPPEPALETKDRNGTIKQLREALKNHKELKEPKLIKVKGTFFPAALLNAGWWESVRDEVNINWRSSLQQWLFEGFDLWAPSWDISWDFENSGRYTKSSYCVAQLTDGDEADSIAVIIPPKLANVWRDKFRNGWGGCEVSITGILGHRSQARNELPQGNVLCGQAEDYCIWLKDDDNQYKIEKLNTKTDLYSGYLWQCWIPRKWWEESDSIGLKDVYIVWEHTNFAAKDAYNYNLSSLRDKVSYIEKTDGELILLQKSHGLLVPGDPLWSIEDFYKILTHRSVKK